MPAPQITAEQYAKILIELEKNGRDGFGNIAHITLGLLGAVGGAAAAPVIASAAGATSITGISWLASFVGVTAAAATPVGWFVGCAAGGAVLAYGIGKAVRRGGKNDEKRRALKEEIWTKIRNYKASSAELPEEQKFKNVIHILRLAEEQNKFSRVDGFVIIQRLKTGELTTNQALEVCEGLLSGNIRSLTQR